MRTLNVKLLRNLWSLRGQGGAIALVVAAGVAMFVMSLSVLDSLRLTQQSMYDAQRFAEIFVSLKRAPESVADRLRELDGVATLESRVVAPVNLRLEMFDEPVVGLAVSIPDGTQPELNRLFLRAGALPAPDRADQLLVSESFALAHGLATGDNLSMVIGGRYQRFQISGLALTPEFIYQIRPGELFPDFKRYAVVWMNRSALAGAYGMEGAFNSVVVTLEPGYPPPRVIDAIDEVLAPWGGLGAHDRDEQISHRFIDQELEQLEGMAVFLPLIFIGVAAFLLNVVAARLIRTQREQIAILKAFGYENLTVALHYLALIIVIVIVGSLAGILLGRWLASAMSVMYQDFFRFPYLEFRVRPVIAGAAVLIAGGATTLGSLGALRSAFSLPPAEAMRPEPPARYRRTVVERLGIRGLSQPARMVLRNLERAPVKAALSMIGIASAVALLMMTGFQQDAVNHMLDAQFRLSQKQDATVTFYEPASHSAVHELAALTGVRRVEGFRSVPVVLRYGAREYRTALQGFDPDGDLFTLLDDRLKPITLPPDGVMLTDHLGHMLGVEPGDLLQVEVLEGRRPKLEIPVAALASEFVGVGAYMRHAALARYLREGLNVSGAFVAMDREHLAGLHRALEDVPRIAGVTLRENMINSFTELMDESMLVFTFFAMIMAGSIAFSVVYNNARIAFSERARELASLRVLGFTQAEVSSILIGELVLLTLLALPLGFLLGNGLCRLLIRAVETDMYRIPLILEPATYAWAAAVVLIATLISTGLIGRKLRRLDMVLALKAAE